MTYRTITSCRACGSSDLDEVLRLGEQPVSDFVADPTAPPDRAPLTLLRCADCALVQLADTVDRERLFRRYFYRSATNPSMVAALSDLAADGRGQVTLERGDHVLDIGCGDGTLLGFLPTWVRCLGVDPSDVADAAVGVGAAIVHDYWPLRRYPVPVVPCRIIYSAAVLYSVENLPAFVDAVRTWLHPDGVWMVQVSYLPATLATNNFTDVVHEHVAYFTVRSLARLVERHGLKITRVAFNDVNGGSVRLTVRHAASGEPAADLPGDDVTADEVRLLEWSVAVLRGATRGLLEDIRAAGHLCVGLGAATKASTMLAVYGIGPDLLPAIGDRNPAKDGLYTVTGIPIRSEEAVRAMKPDYGLILPWHFADGIIERERAHIPRFVVPLPHIRVVVPAAYPEGGVDGRRLEAVS